MSRLRFGIFMAPFHPAGENPTLALQRDLELIEHLDGWATTRRGSASTTRPAARSSPRRRSSSPPPPSARATSGSAPASSASAYHNPLWVAERMVLLDHLTRGRAMLGVGPGSLPTDSAMIGLDPTDTRELLDANFDIVMRLLRRDEPVNAETTTHTLVDARLHLRPYTEPHPDVAVAAVASPAGPRLAGRYGHGLLSIGATTAAGFDVLALHWDVMEERAATLRHQRRPQRLAPGRPDAHRRDARAGLSRRRVRHRAVVPLLPAGRRVPADGGPGRECARNDRFRQHGRDRRRRHDRRRGGAGRRSSSTSRAGSAPCCCSPTSGPTPRRPGAHSS